MTQVQATSSFSETAHQRWQAITGIWRGIFPFPDIRDGLLGVVVLILIGSWVFGDNGIQLPDNMLAYVTNVFTESLSVILTILVLDRFADRRSERELKESMLARARSRNNAVALGAIDEIRAKGWLTGENGLLKGVNLDSANLENANLQGANLSGTEFRWCNLSAAEFTEANLSGAMLPAANLSNAKLSRTDLSGADLFSSDLSDASLHRANLSGAHMMKTNLSGASLWDAKLLAATLREANLSDANLTGADLTGADLREARFDHTHWKKKNPFGKVSAAITPVGKIWTTETDLARFIDPEHTHFEATLEQINELRLNLGEPLMHIGKYPNVLYPLPKGKRFKVQAMRRLVNVRRRHLGLEPLP